jgi:hypothetical protein
MRIRYAPKEVSAMISKMIGMPYIMEKNPSVPLADPKDGFNCWGFVRHMFQLTGTELPRDAIEARKLFVEVKEPEYRCIISLRSKRFDLLEQDHLGFMETYRMFAHCSGTLGGVARTELDEIIAIYKFFKLR